MTYNGGTYDAFVLKLNADGSLLSYATYLGGSFYDVGNGIAVDAAGNAYLIGFANSSDFPATPEAYVTTYNGGYDTFVVKINASGSMLSYATYLGGINNDEGFDIALDAASSVYVTGWTASMDYPVTSGAYVPTYSGDEMFVAKINFPPPTELPRTGQTTCYDSAGTVIPCAGTGQDGEIQAGVPWPNPRFTDNGDGTVTDNLTGLIWTKDANAPGPGLCFTATWKTWQDALNYVDCLNTSAYLGHSDWRLPNVNELETLINAKQPNTAAWLNTQGFSNVQLYHYWTSTSIADNPGNAWVVHMWFGYMFSYGKSGDLYVWPVRSGQTGMAQLWETGQTTCYDIGGNVISCGGTGQDGDIRAGVSWPGSRFRDNGDETVIDNLTGFMWTKDAYPPGTYGTWQQALDYVNGMNAGTYPNFGYMDWRLPNRKELHSLSDFSRYNPALPSGHPFLNVQSDYYWSSTSFAHDPDDPWIVDMSHGDAIGYNNKSSNGFLWPVRGGNVPPFEVCDGIDNDGDGLIDEGLTTAYYRDADGDGYGDTSISIQACSQPAGYASNDLDCNDGNAAIHQGAVETCNLLDDNCDGNIDEGVQNIYYQDADGDTYGNVLVAAQACAAPSGYVSNGADCNDSNASIYPGATEVCNGTDDNCNGQINEGVQNTYYSDADSDTYGNASLTTQACTQPLGYVSSDTDCNDTDATVYPGAPEIPNDGIDQDCNGQDLIVNTAPVVWNIPDISFLEDGSGTLPGNASLDTYVSDIETLDPFISWAVLGGTNVTAIINPDRTVTFTAAPDFNGQETLTFIATDTGYGTSPPLSASDTVVVTVTPVNDPPVLDPIGAKSIDEGSLLSFTVSGNDLEGDPLTFSATNLPLGATFVPATRTFSWTPDYTQAGLHSVTFMVNDGALMDSEVVTITVNNVNRAPVADAGADETMHVGTLVTLNGSASSDPDGDYPLTYAWNIISKPHWQYCYSVKSLCYKLVFYSRQARRLYSRAYK